MVCFDLGGVIVRHCRNWAEGCAAAGLPAHPGLAEPWAIARRREVYGLHTKGLIDGDEYCRRMAATTDGLYSPEDVARIHYAWLLGEYEGVGRVIESLIARGRVATGVLSNTNVEHWARFETGNEFPTVARLDNRHASHLLGLAKPSPDFYKTFEQATGFDGHPGAILFFDDLPDNIATANALGWCARLIDHTTDTAAQIELHLRDHGVL